MRNARLAALAAAAPLALAAAPAFPCAVCFGDPASPLTQGAKAGVLFMAVMVYMVVMMMGGVALFWYIRARQLRAQAVIAEQAGTAAEKPDLP